LRRESTINFKIGYIRFAADDFIYILLYLVILILREKEKKRENKYYVTIGLSKT